jgi:LEA14-like dessication related protein
MRRRRALRARRGLLPALAVVLAGCALVRDVERPDVALESLRIVDAQLLQQTLGLGLRVANPNDFEIDLRGLRFALELRGEKLAEGESDTQVRIPAGGEADIDVTARTTALSLLRQLRGLGRAEGLPYRLSGDVRIGGLFGFTQRLPFEKEGTVEDLLRDRGRR